MTYIEDFKDGEAIIGHFLCRRKAQGKTRAGKPYLSLTLADRTGQIEAKVWDLGTHIGEFESGSFIKVDGDVLLYNGEPQLKVNRLRTSVAGEFDPADYIPRSEKDIDGMWTRLSAMIDTIKDVHLSALLYRIYTTDQVLKLFTTHSAGKQLHHAYSGGLLEHTLSVAETCDFLCGRYKFVNRDLCITAALLHDIGKLSEISPFPENDYTDDGQLLGHIYMTSAMVERESREIEGFPDRLRSLLIHCLLSHHGEYEYGSPQLPKTIEAMILHVSDNADAKLKMFESTFEETSGLWTHYHKALGRMLTKSDFNPN